MSRRRNSLAEYPVNQNGDLVAWQGDIVLPGEESEYRPVTPMVPNEPFESRLRFLGYGRGRSSAVFYWSTEDEHHFQMFMTDMQRAVALFGIEPAQDPPETVRSRCLWATYQEVLGYCSGRWRVVKRGQNYGLQPMETDG